MAYLKAPVVRAMTVFALLALALVGCGAVDEGEFSASSGPAVPERAAPAQPSAMPATDQSTAAVTSSSMGAEEVASDEEAVEEVASASDAADGDGERSARFFQSAPLTGETQTSVQPQNRVIVRTVDMGIIVADVPQAADDILSSARGLGGWQVTSDRSRTHRASVSVRVPAETLDEFVDAIRDMAEGVEYETSSSRDVTDEYVDNQARLNGLRATEERLLEFLAQAAEVEDALKVQAELTRIQLEIESIQGRLRFLSQTSAYSLVNLSLTTKPGVLAVEIGQDAATYRAGRSAGFQATFEAPEGVEEFTFTWDFGDGSEPVQGRRTAPTTNAGERITATVTHAFKDVEQSPYIVQLEISGIGDAGVFEGADTLIATVTEIPGIDVFAGEFRVVDEGDEMAYSGSFTRPESLRDFEYRWDFGDGSATVVGLPAEGATRATASHAYRDYRPDPYEVVLTVTAQSDAGEVTGAGSFLVQVNEAEGFIVAGWDAGGAAKSAVRALTAVGQGLLIGLIWLGILSPVWLVILAVVILAPRLRRRFRPQRQGGAHSPPGDAPSDDASESLNSVQ